MRATAIHYVTDESGEPTAVIVPVDEYRALLEDPEDLAVIAERRDEPTVSHEEVLAELRRRELV